MTFTGSFYDGFTDAVLIGAGFLLLKWCETPGDQLGSAILAGLCMVTAGLRTYLRVTDQAY